MNIEINNRKKISTLQTEFNSVYPYLKLEFFSKPHPAGGASAKRFMIANSKLLGEFKTFHGDKKTITIIPSMTVKDLEQNFRNTYGLSVQVFRKSGKVWLETTVTDAWTLEEQNLQGEALSKHKSD
jgi:hypothetical protein